MESDGWIYLVLRYAVRELLEMTGHELDWQETTFGVDFGSYTTRGNLRLPEDAAIRKGEA